MDNSRNERQLIAAAQAGDQEAFGALYEAYAQSIFQYISYRVDSQMLAEDLTAEVFLRMVRGLKDYEDRDLPLGAWLFKIASNLVHEHYRQGKRMTLVELSGNEHSDDSDPFDRLDRQEERQRLREALRALPAEYQDVLILRFMKNLSHAEVAALLDKSETAVRTIQHRALKALGEQLGSPGKQRSYLRGKRP